MLTCVVRSLPHRDLPLRPARPRHRPVSVLGQGGAVFRYQCQPHRYVLAPRISPIAVPEKLERLTHPKAPRPSDGSTCSSTAAGSLSRPCSSGSSGPRHPAGRSRSLRSVSLPSHILHGNVRAWIMANAGTNSFRRQGGVRAACRERRHQDGDAERAPREQGEGLKAGSKREDTRCMHYFFGSRSRDLAVKSFVLANSLYFCIKLTVDTSSIWAGKYDVWSMAFTAPWLRTRLVMFFASIQNSSKL